MNCKKGTTTENQGSRVSAPAPIAGAIRPSRPLLPGSTFHFLSSLLNSSSCFVILILMFVTSSSKWNFFFEMNKNGVLVNKIRWL